MSFFLDDLFPGTEAIAFQAHSKLGKRLEEVFQDVLNYKANLDYSVVGTDEKSRREYRVKKVIDYCRDVMAEKFVKVLLDELGWYCKKITLAGNLYSGCTGHFSINICISDMTDAAGRAIGRATNNQDYVNSTNPSAYAEKVFAELADCIDLNKSRLNKNKIGGRLKIPVYAPVINMDPCTAFLMEDFIPEEVAKPMTAAEVAAILMHEIGHAMTVIEHAADLFVTVERVKQCAVNIKSIKDTKSAKAILKSFDKKIIPQVVKAGSDLPKEHKKMFDSIIRMATRAVHLGTSLCSAAEESSTSSKILTAIGAVLFGISAPVVAIILMIQTLAFVALFLTYIVPLFTIVVLIGNEATGRGNGGLKPKTTDRAATTNDMFLLERWADEFVSRHGYGVELNSALAKIQPVFDYVTNAGNVKWSGPLLWVIELVMYIESTFDITRHIHIASGYEHDFWRVRRVVQNTKQFFKEAHLPQTVVDSWLVKLDKMEDQLAESKSIYDTEAVRALGNILNNTLNPIEWIRLFRDGKMDRDFAILQDRTDDILSNKLYALSHKLSRL